jgi:hypothetical protein
MKQIILRRAQIIRALVNALRPLDYVHAFWEGGAAAFDRIDEWSDIDVNIVVDDGKAREAFAMVEKALESLSPIRQKHEILHQSESGISQAFYKLRDTSEYLLIDLAIFDLSSPDKFLEPEIHGKTTFYFNKSNRIKIPRLKKSVLIKKLQKRLAELRERFDIFNIFVQKEINRGNHVEAIDLYHRLTLAFLIEALRIEHNPVHHDFKTRYVHYEFPSEVIERLERLHFVKDEDDLQEKYDEATDWFYKTMKEIATVDQVHLRLKDFKDKSIMSIHKSHD